ncbi:MAG: alpha/beta hydrolase [Ruminiclostridium sp.]|nr:alpha/beta hydrolase [Ruminiclostridium sp.]
MYKQRNKNIKGRFPVWISYILVIAVSVGATLAGVNAFKKSEEPKKAAVQGKNANIGSTKVEGTENREGSSKAVNGKKDITFIDNWYMDTRVRFVMDGIWHRMGNVEEILDTVKNIRHTSELSWFREWDKTAARIEGIGDESLKKGHEISAGDAYLRAANYYLAAEVFLHTNPDDQRIPETYKKGGDLFVKGQKLLRAPMSVVEIPYEGITLRGYFFKTPLKEKAPTILLHQGFDAPVEATKYIAEEAIKRGYNCLLFEGPGQGLTIREKKLPFRSDWEKVVTPVVDYLLARDDVDGDNLILTGMSMGGGYVVRAAAFEHRIKYCIANPGYVNMYDMFKDILGSKFVNLYEQDPKEFDRKFLDTVKYDVGLRWGIYHGMWVFGCKTPSELLSKLKEYDYTGVLDQITSHMLVMDGTGETWGKGQAKKLYDALKSPKDYMLFTEEDSASKHCQSGAPAISTQRMFDWLDERMAE